MTENPLRRVFCCLCDLLNLAKLTLSTEPVSYRVNHIIHLIGVIKYENSCLHFYGFFGAIALPKLARG